MGIGDSIRKAADNSMKDLGDNAPPADDGHAPSPGGGDGDVQVNSSISEGSNAMTGYDENRAEEPNDKTAKDSLAGDITKTLDPDQDVADSAGTGREL